MHITANGIRIHYTLEGAQSAPLITLSHSLATDLTIEGYQKMKIYLVPSFLALAVAVAVYLERPGGLPSPKTARGPLRLPARMLGAALEVLKGVLNLALQLARYSYASIGLI